MMMSTREEYFVDHVDVNVPANRTITIPENAVGDKLRSVCYLQATSPLTLINLPRIDLDVVAGVGFANYDTLAGFYVEGNNLILYPNTSVPVYTNLRLYYYKRTLVLAPPSAYGQILTVDPMTNEITVDFVPSTWAIGTVLNTVSSVPGFSVTNSECIISSLSAPTIILDTVEGISVGDYISEQGFSAVPQVPIEAHAYLAQLTAVKCLEGLGDTQGMQNAQEKANEMQKNMLVMVSNRVDGSGKKIVNPSGGFRVNAGLWRRGWGAW
jgi:hypothetical protein